MAYGAEIRNEFGELVADFNRVLEVAETGMTTSSDDLGMVVNSGQFARVYHGPQTQEVYRFNGNNSSVWTAYPHHIGTGVGSIAQSGNVSKFFPTPLVPLDSTYFYQVGSTGLLHHSEHVIEPPWITNATPQHGMFAMCLPENNVPLPYIRVAPYTPKTFTDGYGMQMLDGDGEVTFDSRADFLSISEVLFVPRATMHNLLQNGGIVNLPLRTPVPDCYIAAPNHTSFLRPGGSSTRYRHIKIEQTSDTNLRISRVNHGPSFNLNTTIGVANDTVIIVARNPF